jgi:hypothetical protein
MTSRAAARPFRTGSRYDAHDQSFADAQGIGIENTAATEDVEDRTAFPRPSARDLQEAATICP